MRYLQIKDNKIRQKFRALEARIKLRSFVYKNILSYINKNELNFKKKRGIRFQILKTAPPLFSNKFVRRCVITNRAKSIRPFKVSRILARELMSFGIIPGFQKAVW